MNGALAQLASMRPQHNAAEYLGEGIIRQGEGEASMRPQHNAAEYAGLPGRPGVPSHASMRPQHNAAEYLIIMVGAG